MQQGAISVIVFVILHSGKAQKAYKYWNLTCTTIMAFNQPRNNYRYKCLDTQLARVRRRRWLCEKQR